MLTWTLHDLRSGILLDELPLTPSGDIEATFGAPTSLDVTLDLADDACPPNWESLIDPRRVMIVVCDDKWPLIGYVVSTPQVAGSTATYGLQSLEACADRVFVGDHEFTEGVDDEADVLATLWQEDLVDGFGFDLDITTTGKSADHSYYDAEDRSVLSASQALMQADDGPEWRIVLSWADQTHNRIVKTVEIAPRVGDDQAEAIFDDKVVTARTRRVDYGPDSGAVIVRAVADGSGSNRPMSADHVDQDAIDHGVPPWEARVSVTGIDDDTPGGPLDRAAISALKRMRLGATTWDIEADAMEPACPRVGRSFTPGDTVQMDLGPTEWDPASWKGPARLQGYRATVQENTITTITPVLWVDPEGEAS